MRRLKTTMAAACVTLAMTAGMATAQTSPADRKTFVTFSGPVSVPGMTLPAGTYTFRILDSNTDRHIVQVFTQDESKLMTTLLAVSAQRLEPTGDPVITFKETASNRAPAVRYWYYAGDLAGNEFVYPKNQAQMIADASGEDVMSVDSTSTSIDDWKSGSMSRVKPANANAQSATSSSTTASTTSTTASSATSSSTTTASDTTAAQPAQPTTAPSTTSSATTQPTTTADQGSQPTTAQPTTTTPSAATQPTTSAADTRPTTAPSTAVDQTAQPTTAAPTTAPSAPETVGTSGRTERLPKTASELPMVGLIGLLALGGAVALRAARTV
jgi:hypothetical protein